MDPTPPLLIRHATLPDGRTGMDLLAEGGRVVSRMAPATAELALPGRPVHVDFTRQAPRALGGGDQ